MNITNAVSASFAAAPAASRSACRSCSRLPLSARPGSGSKSRPTSMSWNFIRRALAKPASARSPRRARLLAFSIRDSRSKATLISGASSAGNERLSGASMRSVCIPADSASSRILSRSTVLPTPRSPTMTMLFVGRPRRIRSSATRTVSRSSSRPASSGGGVPAPGAKGFETLSTGEL